MALIELTLYSQADDTPLTGAASGITFTSLVRVNTDASVDDLADSAPTWVELDAVHAPGMYQADLDDALLLPGSEIRYVVDAGTSATQRFYDGEVTAAVVDLPAETLEQSDLTIRRGDLLPVFERVLLNERGGRLDLSGEEVSVQFRMRVSGGSELAVSGDATIVGDGKHGRVRYEWSDGDTSQAGTYDAEFAVSGGPTAPATRFYRITIVNSLLD
jgi:hypothetical protein